MWYDPSAFGGNDGHSLLGSAVRTLLCGAVLGALVAAVAGGVLSQVDALALQDKVIATVIAGLVVTVGWWAFGVFRALIRRMRAIMYRRWARRWRRAELAAAEALHAVEDEVTSPLEGRPSFGAPDPARNKALLRESAAAVARNDLDGAVRALSELIAVAPAHLEAHLARGRIYGSLGAFEPAMRDLMRAETLAPYDPEPLVAMGELCFGNKDYVRAIAYYDTVLVMEPSDAMTYSRRGLAHYYRKNAVMALDDFKAARRLDRTTPNIDAQIAMCTKRLASEERSVSGKHAAAGGRRR